MPVSSGQGDIPCNEFSKTGVKITLQGKITAKKHRQVNAGLRGNPAQQRGLVLDRVGHQIS
jgi:hypothetical protein